MADDPVDLRPLWVNLAEDAGSRGAALEPRLPGGLCLRTKTPHELPKTPRAPGGPTPVYALRWPPNCRLQRGEPARCHSSGTIWTESNPIRSNPSLVLPFNTPWVSPA